MRQNLIIEHIERQHASKRADAFHHRGTEFAEFGACLAKIPLRCVLRASAVKIIFKERTYGQATS